MQVKTFDWGAGIPTWKILISLATYTQARVSPEQANAWIWLQIYSQCESSPIRKHLQQQSSTSDPTDVIILAHTTTFAGIIHHCPHKISLTKSSTTVNMYNFYRFGNSAMWNHISPCISQTAENTQWCHHLCQRAWWPPKDAWGSTAQIITANP